MCKHSCQVALYPPPKVGGFTAMEDKTPFEAMQATHNGDINSMQDKFNILASLFHQDITIQRENSNHELIDEIKLHVADLVLTEFNDTRKL